MTISANFRMVSFWTIYGFIYLFNTLGNSLGPLYAGHTYDVTGEYHSAILLLAVLYGIAILSALLIKKPEGARLLGSEGK